MNGQWLYEAVLEALNEISASASYVTERAVYTALDRAAEIFARETGVLQTSASITTVAEQQSYDLPPNFIRPSAFGKTKRCVMKSDDGTYQRFVDMVSFDRLFMANETTSQDHPSGWWVRPKQSAITTIAGTAATDAASSNTGAQLLDTGADFSGVNARDSIQNTTDGSIGLVLSVASDTAVNTVLFDTTGARCGWSKDDVYTVIPAVEWEIYLNAPSKTAGYTLTLPYVCRPNPLYVPFGVWNMPERHALAIASGAAMIIKQPKRDFSGALQMGGLFRDEIERCKRDQARALLNAHDWR